MQMQLDSIANKVEMLSALVERIAVTSKVVIPSTNFGTTSAKSHKRHRYLLLFLISQKKIVAELKEPHISKHQKTPSRKT